jgi:hypothetical protein
MIEAETLKSIATQLVTGTSVSVGGISTPVRRTSRQLLKTAAFSVDGQQYQAIEQNPGEAQPMGAVGAEWLSGRAIQGRRKQQVRGSRC